MEENIQDISVIQDKIINVDNIVNSLKESIKAATKKIYSKQSFILNVVITREESNLFTDLDFLTDELADENYKIQLSKVTDFSNVKENLFSIITSLNNEDCGIYIDSLNTFLESYESIIYSMVHPSKDVGAFNIVNTGLLFYEQQLLFPPIVSTVLKILDDVKLAGKYIVILNKTARIGKSLAMSLLQKGANISLLDHNITDFKKLCKHASIVISAINEPLSINYSMLKKDVFVIDIGDELTQQNNLIFSGAENVINKYVTPEIIYQLQLLFILYNFLRVIFFNHKDLFE